MISEKQLPANRENAKQSTGPKTEETKRIVSQNALRHSLTGQVTLMPDEDRTAHDNLCTAIVPSLAPEGALETQLAQAIAEDNWRTNRDMEKALDRLHSLQTERKARRQQELEEAAALLQFNEIKLLPSRRRGSPQEMALFFRPPKSAHS